MVLLLDGAMGTELQQRGYKLDPNLWSVGLLATDPEAVYQLHLDYYKHGADIITTNTYQISFESFQLHWHYTKEETIQKICNKALEIAFQARRAFSKQVALSMSTYGANILINSVGAQEFRGEYVDGSIKHIEAKMFAFHEEKLQVFMNYCQDHDEYPDYILFETVPVLLEAQVIAQVVNKFSTLLEKHSIITVVSFSCRNEHQTNHGEEISDCAQFIASQYPLIQGMSINCTSPSHTLSLLQLSRPHLHLKQQLWCYPNSGETWNHEQQNWKPLNETQDFETCIKQIIAKKLCDVVGGCCRTTVSSIKSIYHLLHQ